MLILLLVLLMGLFAAVWGFMACFLPSQWNRFSDTISLADRWSESIPERRHPLIRLVRRLAECIGGLGVCAVGCWFTYLAGSSIYRRLTGQGGIPRAPISPEAPVSGTLPNTPAPAATALAVFMILAGVLMAIFPEKAVAVFERV